MSERTKVFFDTEFIEDGRTIDLISIGLIKETGGTLYLESSDCDLSRASDWVKANVLPQLHGPAVQVPRWRMAQCIQEFVGERPEFWAYYADYDWVALCQLYGAMVDLPKGWPMFCMDIKQLCVSVGNPRLPKQEGAAHHALGDAQWALESFRFLDGLTHSRKTGGGESMAILAPPSGGGFEGVRQGMETR